MADKQAQWQDFIDKLESGLSDARQNVDSIINDGTATEEQKRNAASDYAKQSLFLQQVQGMYDNGDYNNPTNTFGVNGTGAVYLSYKDNRYHSLTLAPWVYNGDITQGDTITAQVMSSDEISLVSTLEDIWSGTKTVTGEEIQRIDDTTLYVGCTFGVGTYGTGFHATLVDANDYFSGVDLAQYTRGPQGVFAGVYIPSYSGAPQSALIRDTFSGTSQSRGYWSSGNGIYAGYATIIEIQPEDAENPWDYYNDNILPTILDPDNKALPGGYTPVAPDDPPDEPEDLPHDDGDPPANQTDRTLSVPFNFITQYLLNSEQLMTLGVNLWQSWLTPNTDVWMNFFLPYGQDFGTLNIAACMDYIISLRVYPFEFPLEFFVSSSNGLRMGTGHTDFLGTSVAILKSQIYSLDLGTCEVKPEVPYNDFRDMYNASVMLYLPYCGTVELNPAEVMYRTLHAYYYIDVQSGGCTAVVTCNGDSGEYNIAAKSGQIGFSIPLTATNAGQLAAQTMKDAVQTVSTIGGFVFDTFGEITKAAGTAISILGSGNSSMDGLPSNLGSKETTLSSSSRMGENMFNTATSLANQALDRLSRSGIGMPMLSGGTGAEAMMFPDCVYLQIRRGKYAKPVNYPHSQGHLNGSSNKISYYAGAFKGTPTIPGEYKGKGLCKFAGVDTTGLTCHDDERAEIVALLESGIYI